MSTTFSLVHKILRKVRDILDKSDATAKFTDSTLMVDYVPEAFDNVMSRLAIDNPDEVTAEFDLELVKDQEFYDLPSNVKKVLSLTRLVDGFPVEDLEPGQLGSRSAVGWLVEGNQIRVLRGTERYGTTFSVRYVPGGLTFPHYQASVTGLALLGTDRTGGSLPVLPTVGVIDPKPRGYVGQVLRVFVGGLVEERILSEYEPVTRTFSVRVPFTASVPVDSTAVAYEVVPSELASVANCVAMNVAMTLSTPLNMNPMQAQMIQREYLQSLKTAFETLHHRQAYRGAHKGSVVQRRTRSW